MTIFLSLYLTLPLVKFSFNGMSKTKETKPHHSVYNEICVLDTNFLISKLGYLDTVLSLAEQHVGSLLIVLPWVVIRELDGLKVS